jgi:hypothetical protein
MKTSRFFAISLVLALPVLLTGVLQGGDKKKPKNDMCAAGNAQSICNAESTCGSATSPCRVDIRRDEGDSASATPEMSAGKSNVPFCVKAGTTITFVSKSKNTGFVLDFGNSSPFDYTYSVGACMAGTIYGMCGEHAAQLVVSAK